MLISSTPSRLSSSISSLSACEEKRKQKESKNSKENQQLRTQNSFQQNVTRATKKNKKQCIYSSDKQLKYVPTFYSSGPYKRNTVRINKQSFHRQLQT